MDLNRGVLDLSIFRYFCCEFQVQLEVENSVPTTTAEPMPLCLFHNLKALFATNLMEKL